MTSDACQRAKADFERHQQACLATLKARHATVQGYAAWLFGECDVSAGDHSAGIPVPQVDFERLRTVEEADAAWLYVKRAMTDSAEDKQRGLPSGQPHGLEAFADAASSSIRVTGGSSRHRSCGRMAMPGMAGRGR